jgi:hypothetical protein
MVKTQGHTNNILAVSLGVHVGQWPGRFECGRSQFILTDFSPSLQTAGNSGLLLSTHDKSDLPSGKDGATCTVRYL